MSTILKQIYLIRLRRRRLVRNGRSKFKMNERVRRNVSRKSGPDHLEEARKLLDELEKERNEKSVSESEECSRKFLLDNLPYRAIRSAISYSKGIQLEYNLCCCNTVYLYSLRI